MAEQRGGQVRKHTNLKLNGGGDINGADDGAKTVDSRGVDDSSGLFSVEYFKKLNSDLSVGIFDVHEDVSLPGNATEGTGSVYETFDGADEDVRSSDFLNSIFVDAADGTESLGDLFTDLNSENLNFGSCETIDDYLKEVTTIGPVGLNGEVAGTAARRIRLPLGYQVGVSCDSLETKENSENGDFGRDTNRLDYFRVTAFDVNGDDNLTGVACYGGGGGGTRDREVVVDPIPEQERSSATAVAGGGILIRRGTVGSSANNGSDGGEQESGSGGRNGGRRRLSVVAGERLEQERGGATAGAGGGDRTREVPAGIFANSDSDGGEAVVKRLKQEKVSMTVPLAAVMAVVVLMVMMLTVMVVLVFLMLKMEVR